MTRSIGRWSSEMSLWLSYDEPWFTSHGEHRTAGAARAGALFEGGARKAGMPGSGVLRLLGHELELVDHSAELGKRTGVHLPHRPATVDLHRGFGDADIAGNLFAEATARDLNHDLALPGTKRREALPKGGQSHFILSPSTITRKAKLNRVEQLLITERLRQEVD